MRQCSVERSSSGLAPSPVCPNRTFCVRINASVRTSHCCAHFEPFCVDTLKQAGRRIWPGGVLRVWDSCAHLVGRLWLLTDQKQQLGSWIREDPSFHYFLLQLFLPYNICRAESFILLPFLSGYQHLYPSFSWERNLFDKKRSVDVDKMPWILKTNICITNSHQPDYLTSIFSFFL